jgi:hypothetical protein
MNVTVGIEAHVSEDAPVTITIKMPLGYWKAAHRQLRDGDSERYEANVILRAIDQAVGRMSDQWNRYVEVEP